MNTDSYNKLTPLMTLRLAAPHTWPGPSILTSILGGLLAISFGFAFSPIIWIMLLAVAVLMQSAVNTLNDWADFRKGTDTIENSEDPADAVLVYDNPNPTHVLVLGIAFMGAALVLGIISIVWSGGLLPLLFGILGAIVIVIYSSGKLPISHLPLGEVVSGVVMGCLIPLAILCVFAERTAGSGLFAAIDVIPWGEAIAATVPFIIGIGMVMATQNNCDIERDALVGRKTLPIVLGHDRSLVVYRVVVIVWLVVVALIVIAFYGGGAWVLPVMLVFSLPTIRGLLTNPLVAGSRGRAMGLAGKANLLINGSLIIAITISQIPIALA